jgi:hypothetical protein
MVLGNRVSKLGGDGNGQEESESTEEIDDAYRPQVLDLFGDEELADYAPTGPVDQAERIGIDYDRRRLKILGERARALAGPKEDRKLARLIEIDTIDQASYLVAQAPASATALGPCGGPIAVDNGRDPFSCTVGNGPEWVVLQMGVTLGGSGLTTR